MSIVHEGIVITGEYLDWTVIVDDDREGETGGYYLYLQKSETQGFDYWFEDEAGLHAQLGGFDIAWKN